MTKPYPQSMGYRFGWALLIGGAVLAAVALSEALRWMGVR